MKTPSSPGSVKSTCVAKKVQAAIAVVAARRHVGERRRHQRAADAVADRRDLALAGRLLDRVERGQRARAHVVVEVQLGQPLVGVDPGDDEHRVALLGRPLDERVLGLEVEDVELVDPRRHDQQRRVVDLRRRRRVLQQLDQLVLVDDLAGRGRDVLADLEGLEVGHRMCELALAALEVVEQVLQPLHQVLALATRRWPSRPSGWSARSWTAPSRRRTGACRSRPSCAVLSSSPSTWLTVCCSQRAVSR